MLAVHKSPAGPARYVHVECVRVDVGVAFCCNIHGVLPIVTRVANDAVARRFSAWEDSPIRPAAIHSTSLRPAGIFIFKAIADKSV